MGLTPETQATMDTDRRRTTDALSLEDEPNATTISAILRRGR
ncbi:hypothetical protein AB0L28_29205 [Streptomyces sp. NPDC052503]|nr:hypothetical protein [Streptomyces sp. SID7834]